MFKKKKKMKTAYDMIDRVVLIKTVSNAVIEANRNGCSEPFYCPDAELAKAAVRFFLNREGYCISKPFYRNLSLDECRYYFDPDDLIEIHAIEGQMFILVSNFKEYAQELKHSLDTMLQKVEQDYNDLHPIVDWNSEIVGWDSEYDEFMD